MGDTRSIVASNDTSPKAHEVYLQRLSEMTPPERVRLGTALWQAGHSLQWAAARRKYPDANDEELAFQIAVTRFGEELARAAFRRS